MPFSHTLKSTLDTLGLLGPAFWVNSRLRILRLRRQPPSGQASPFADGLPLPPPELLVGIGGPTNPDAYLHGGLAIATAIAQLLSRHGIALAQLGDVLDFGCGCGRIVRRLRPMAPSAALHGTDYNAAQIVWCRQHLAFARFETNGLAPPLSWPDRRFDFVYAFSVFTHLTQDLQVAWMQELRRVTRPGGHVLVTVHPPPAALQLSAPEQARFNRGELVVRYQNSAGSNACAAFHPIPYINGTLAAGWQVVDLAETDLSQLFVLLRRPAD